jgi:SAM-dependent methyltransferase
LYKCDAWLPLEIRLQRGGYFVNCFLDLLDTLTGRSRDGAPPRRLNISGGGTFRAIGEHNVAICKRYAGLMPDDALLDVGCGIGRSALALTTFLSATGRYTGFDVIDFAIRWCQRTIGAKHANFCFIHSDIYNKQYNRKGRIDPQQYVFPAQTGSISFCLATSLFTHLLPSTTERYVSEVARVLRPDGRFLATWFLLDEETEASAAAGKAEFTFGYRFEKHAQVSIEAPEEVVAYKLDYLRALFAEVGLVIVGVHHGGWSGTEDRIDSGQDVIVCRRAF